MKEQLPAPSFSAHIDEAEISIYQNGFASHLSGHMERLYQNVFSSMEKFEADGDLSDAECYVSVKGAGIATVLVFTRRHGTVQVLNRVVSLLSNDVEIFSKAVFAAYPGVHRIRFEGVQCALGGLPFPRQQHNCLEDIVITLPESVPAYLNMLGKSTRASLKRYHKKMQSDFSGYRWDIYERDEISPAHIKEIIALSSSRISSKKMKSSHTEAKTLQLMDLLKVAGSVLVATIDGRVCGGVICTSYGENFFMHVIAHDSCYNTYRLGKVCLFLSIQAAIERGAKEYHLLWGKYEYKFHLLGIQRDYDRAVIYRSLKYMALSPRLLVVVALRGYGRQSKTRLQNINLKKYAQATIPAAMAKAITAGRKLVGHRSG